MLWNYVNGLRWTQRDAVAIYLSWFSSCVRSVRTGLTVGMVRIGGMIAMELAGAVCLVFGCIGRVSDESCVLQVVDR